MTATVARPGPHDICLQLHEPTDVRLVERLLDTDAVDPDLDVIVGVVNRCRAELAGVPAGAMPELLERLVRQRLS